MQRPMKIVYCVAFIDLSMSNSHADQSTLQLAYQACVTRCF